MGRKNKLFLILVLIAIFFVPKVKASSIELDFSNKQNAWGITDKITFTLPDEIQNYKYYHIVIKPEINELLVFYYDNPMFFNSKTNKLEFESQRVYLKIYRYNSSTKKFDFNSNFNYSGTIADDVNFISYGTGVFSRFPNWSRQYDTVKDTLIDNEKYKKNLEYFIQKLHENDYTFIITVDVNGAIHPIISKSGKEFSLDYSTTRYSEDVVYLNNGSGALGYTDNYTIAMLTNDFVDNYITALNTNFDKLSTQTLALPFWSFPTSGFDTNIVLYSSFSDYFLINNIDGFVTIDDKDFIGYVPTFNKYYDYLEILGFQDYIFDEKINTTGINKLIFTFEIPVDKDFGYDLDISLTMLDDYLPRAYIEATEIDDIVYVTDILNEGYDACDSNSYDCVDAYKISGLYGIDYTQKKYLRLVIDTKQYNEDLHIYFKTNYDFTLDYVYSDDEDQFWTTINMQDIYGLYLMPKTAETSNYQTIYLNGKYNIEVYDITDRENYIVLDQQLEYSLINYQYLSNFDEINNLLYFENFDYASGNDEDYTITFDNRYFNHVIKEYPYSEVSITNPNTGEEIGINGGAGYSQKTIAEYLSSAKKFMSSIGDYIKEFFGVISYFFSKLNDTIRNAIIAAVIIGITCCIIVISRK